MKLSAIQYFAPKSYIETAISAAVLSFAHSSISEFDNALTYTWFVFFGTWSIYNLLRVVSLFRRVQQSANWKTVPDLFFVPLHILISALSGVTALILLFFLNFDTNQILFIGVLFFLTLSYRFRWFKVGGVKTALSDLPHLKSILVALVWTIICSIIPSQFDQSKALLFVSMFIYFLGLTIPFDIRDYQNDAPSRRTIPQVFGLKNARNMSLALLLLAHVLLTYQMKCSIILFSISALFHTFLMIRVNPKSENSWVYRALDASPILIALGIMGV